MNIQPRKGMYFTPMPKDAKKVVAAVMVTKKTKWLRKKYKVMHIVTENGVYEYV